MTTKNSISESEFDDGTNLEVKEVAAEINSLSSELTVDDNAFLMIRMKNNARGSIWVSSAATGGENGLKSLASDNFIISCLRFATACG